MLWHQCNILLPLNWERLRYFLVFFNLIFFSYLKIATTKCSHSVEFSVRQQTMLSKFLIKLHSLTRVHHILCHWTGSRSLNQQWSSSFYCDCFDCALIHIRFGGGCRWLVCKSIPTHARHTHKQLNYLLSCLDWLV